MKYENMLQNLKNQYDNNLNLDEWFFSNFRDTFLREINQNELFPAINYITKNIISENDDTYVIELLNLLLDLVRKANTTEIPEEIKNNLLSLDMKFSKSQYQNNMWNEIKHFYLIY